MVKIDDPLIQCLHCGQKFNIGEEFTSWEAKTMRRTKDNMLEVVGDNVDIFINLCEKCDKKIGEKVTAKWIEIENLVNKEFFDK